MTLQRGERRIGGFGADGDQQATGGLRIEEQILKFGGNAGVESSAIANESAIIFQAAGKMTFARGFDSARKIVEGSVIDFEGNRLDAVTSDRRAPFLARGRED